MTRKKVLMLKNLYKWHRIFFDSLIKKGKEKPNCGIVNPCWTRGVIKPKN